MSASSRVGATALVSVLCMILIVSVSVGAFGGLGSAAVTDGSVDVSPNSPTADSDVTNITVTVNATIDNGSSPAIVSSEHTNFEDGIQNFTSAQFTNVQFANADIDGSVSVGDTDVTDRLGPGSLANAGGVSVTVPDSELNDSDTITVEYTVTATETSNVTVSAEVTNGSGGLESISDEGTFTVDTGSDGGDGAPSSNETQLQVDVDPGDLPGNGTESDPYEIANASELQAMEDELDANYELVSDIDASNTAQFNNGSGFDPVGGPESSANTPSPFTGSLAGNSHTITGLTINRSSESDVGLFGVSSGTVTDVTLTEVTVTGDRFVGGLVGTNRNTGTITNATVSGSITGTDEVGGLVGFNNGPIRDATASGDVTGTDEVGGLVGFNEAGPIRNATASGSVTGGDRVGGLVGLGGNITNAAASGNVTGETQVGGLVGDNFENITNATASGSVTGDSDVGGLVGENRGSIRNATASGAVTGTEDVGGLVGQNLGRITIARASGDVTGEAILGGLVGFNGKFGGSERNVAIQKATASGSVTSVADVSVEGGVGGLVGSNTESIQNASARGTVIKNNAASFVNAGGAVGEHDDGTIQEIFAVGPVRGNVSRGGLVGDRGSSGGTTIESYWDTQATNQNNSAGNATGLTTAQMQGTAAESNMSDFDFVTTWETQSNPDDYPILRALQQDTDSDQSIASVTFEDQAIQNGSTSVDVASATFTGSEKFNLVVHQTTDSNNDGIIQASDIAQKIGESVALDAGTRTNIPVDISKSVADNDDVSQLTENQTLIAMLHTTNTTDGDNIVHTAPIRENGSGTPPVFDQGNITLTDAETGSIPVEEASDVELSVLAETPGPGPAVVSTEPVDIIVGATNSDDRPIEGANVTVELVQSSDETNSDERIPVVKNIKTTNNGNVGVKIDPKNFDDGIYEVNLIAERSGVESFDSDRIRIGPEEVITTESEGATFVNDETQIAIRLMEDREPIAGEVGLIEVVAPDGTVVFDRNISTDDTGFATLNFTPQQQGTYRINQPNNDVIILNDRIEVAELLAEPKPPREVESGQPATIAGRVFGVDGPSSNEEIRVRIFDGFRQNSETEVTSINTTTNQLGLFTAEFEAPQEEGRYTFTVETSSGSEVQLTSFGSFRVETFTDESPPVDDDDPAVTTSPTINADLSTSGKQDRLAPGEDATVSIQAENETGDPLANETVRLTFRYNFDGPIANSVVTKTNASGETTVSFAIPNNAPLGAELAATARIELEDQVISDSPFSNPVIQSRYLSVAEEQGEFGSTQTEITPGEETQIPIEVTDVNGNPVANVTYAFDAQREYLQRSIATQSVTTDNNGEGELNVSVPEQTAELNIVIGGSYDRRSLSGVGTFTRGAGIGPNEQEITGVTLDVAHPNAELNVGQEAVIPGESVNVSFENDEADSGLILLSSFDEPAAGAKIAGPNETVTFNISESISDDAFINIEVLATDQSQARYIGEELLQVDRSVSLQSVVANQTEINPGQSVEINVTVENIGDANETIQLGLENDTQQVAQSSVLNVNSGAQRSTTFTVRPTQTETFSVDSIQGPDISDSITIDVSDPNIVNAEIVTQEPVTTDERVGVNATVSNPGDADGAISLTLRANGTVVEDEIAILAPNETVTAQFNVSGEELGVGTQNLTVTNNLDNQSADAGTITVQTAENETGTGGGNETETQIPSASVTFNNQSVTNGTEEVTVDSANFTRADGSAGDYVVVVHTVDNNEFGAPVGSVSAPIGASGDLTGNASDITVDLNSSAAFEDDDALDTLTENVTLRAMLHTTANDSAFGTRLGNADTITGIEPGDETDDATITVEQAEAGTASASVTFNDQSVTSGTEEVTVDSANFRRADGSAGDYVVVVHTIDELGAPVGEVSAPIGASGDLTGDASDITVDLNSSAAFEDGDALDTLTENVTLRAMLHTTANDSAFGTRLGNADTITGIEPGDETDDATITVEEAGEVVAEFDEDGNGNISITELGQAGQAFAAGQISITELGSVSTAFAQGQSGAITSSAVTLSDPAPTPGSDVTVTVTATPDDGTAGFSFTHEFNQSVASASNITTQVAGSSVDPVIEEVNADGATVTLVSGDITAGEQVTIEYTLTTASDVAGGNSKSVSITGSATSGNTQDLPESSYTVTGGETETVQPPETETGTENDGFGVLPGVIALICLTLIARRRARDGD